MVLGYSIAGVVKAAFAGCCWIEAQNRSWAWTSARLWSLRPGNSRPEKTPTYWRTCKSFLRDSTFDVAVSYLNQCDLPDFEANSQEVFRLLKPGGRFIIANLHPMRSAVGGWLRTKDGTKLHVILDRYFDEGGRRWKMLGIDFTNFHRTLSTYIRVYRQTGFAVEQIIEPTLEAETLTRFPELDDELRVPNFIVVVLGKSKCEQAVPTYREAQDITKPAQNCLRLQL